MALDTFTRFPNLPPEIRLMVWEQTWPRSRIIEPVALDSPEPNVEVSNRLKPRCTIKSWLAHYKGPSRHGPCPRESCPDPVALRVNAESRAHTLSSYVHMRHSPGDGHSFYFSPRRDLLWFTAQPEIGFNKVSGLAANGAYAGCWGAIEMVLGEEPRLFEFYLLCVRDKDNIFEVLPGIRKMNLLMSSSDDEGDEGDGEGEMELHSASAEAVRRYKEEEEVSSEDEVDATDRE